MGELEVEDGESLLCPNVVLSSHQRPRVVLPFSPPLPATRVLPSVDASRHPLLLKLSAPARHGRIHVRRKVQARGGDRHRWLWFVLSPPSRVALLHCLSYASCNAGTVFQGVHTVAGKEVAIKLEPAIAKSSPLKQESKIYKTLMGGPGVPWINWSGKQGDYNVMVIDLLGPSLEDLFRMCNRHFSLKTILMLADQLVSSTPLLDLREEGCNARRAT